MKNIADIFAEFKGKQQEMLECLNKHWGLFLTEGIFFLLLGIAAIIVPQVISVFVIIVLGWLIVLGGVTRICGAWFVSDGPSFGLWSGFAVLQIAMGYLLIAKPFAGVMTLTLIMVLFFALDGVSKIFIAFMMRPLSQWYSVFFSGFTAIVFSAIVLAFWPEIEQWVLGI